MKVVAKRQDVSGGWSSAPERLIRREPPSGDPAVAPFKVTAVFERSPAR